MEKLVAFEVEDTEEFEEDFEDLVENPDFVYLGGFDKLDDIMEDLTITKDFTSEEVIQLNNNRYGDVLEIIQEPTDFYPFHAFIGAR